MMKQIKLSPLLQKGLINLPINVAQLANHIAQTLAEYSEMTEEHLEAIKDEVSTKCVERLKSVSPVLTGSYAKGWRKKRVNTAWVVHNATDYQLTHLLENGHANIAVGKPTPPIPHIRPVELAIIEEFEELVWRLSG